MAKEIMGKIEKVVISCSFGKNPKIKDKVERTLSQISGQKSLYTHAKKSISNFKLRQGDIIGMKVTLRGKKMKDFLTKLINISLPRVRDFRGLTLACFDKEGNYTLGFKEQIVFPEIETERVEDLHGLQITITTSSKTDEEGKKILENYGFPFKKE